MEDGFGYVMQIQDEMSGPAAIEAKSMRSLSAEVKLTEKAIRQLQAAQIKYNEQGLKVSTGNEIAKLRLHQAELKDALGSQTGPSFFPEAAGGFLLAQAISAVGRAAKQAAVGITEFVIGAAEFRKNTTIAYAAVKGSATEGAEVFAQVQRAAESAHMPAEKAHELARDLMLQGLDDAKLIGSTIAAQAALIRTGQVQGAEKLKNIIEKSEASGHFDPGKGLVGKNGQAGSGRALAGLGVTAPDLFASLAKRLGVGIEEVKSQLKAGKVATDVGIAAITDSINQGSIGKAARDKFGIEDFKTDVINAFTDIAQQVDMTAFTQALTDAEAAIFGITGEQSGLKNTFQAIVDGAAYAIEEITLFGQNVELIILDAQLALTGMGDLGNATGDLGSAFGTVAAGTLKVFEAGLVGIVETVDALVTGVEILGATLGFVFGGHGGGIKEMAANFAALKKTITDAGHGLGDRTQTRGDLLFGDVANQAPIRHGNVREPTAVGFGKDVQGFAAGGVIPEPKGPDSVFVAARPGETILPRGFDAGSLSAGVAASVSQAMVSGMGNGSTSHSLSIDTIYIGAEHESGEHLRPLIESTFADLLERIQLEMGG